MKTARIDVDISSTEQTLLKTLPYIFDGWRVQLLVPPGEAEKLVQRMRVKLSRSRKKLERSGRRQRHFILKSSITPWTELDGKRYESIYLWQHVTEIHSAAELLEEILSGKSC